LKRLLFSRRFCAIAYDEKLCASTNASSLFSLLFDVKRSFLEEKRDFDAMMMIFWQNERVRCVREKKEYLRPRERFLLDSQRYNAQE